MFPLSMAGDVPLWVLIFAAICHLLYMVNNNLQKFETHIFKNLDNIDGKQARKTGTSSPLGLLFDHGCDAMNTWITGITTFTVMQFGNSEYSIIGYIFAMLPFFAATWEEYNKD